MTLKGTPNKQWPADERGLVFQPDIADAEGDRRGRRASTSGCSCTVRFIKEVYMNLYAMIAGRVSAKTHERPADHRERCRTSSPARTSGSSCCSSA